MQTNPHPAHPINSLVAILATMLKESAFFTAQDCLFSAHLESNHPKVCFLAGENASGKSLLVKFACAWLSKLWPTAKYVRVSMEERTGSGHSEMGSFRRSMMFGDESEQSTGETSVSTVRKALDNLKSRLDDGEEMLLILDEPELGLSSSYHHALGLLIGDALKAVADNPNCVGLLLVSHSKELYAGLAQGLSTAPSFTHMGRNLTAQQWIADNSRKSLDELNNLQLVARERYRAVSKYMR